MVETRETLDEILTHMSVSDDVHQDTGENIQWIRGGGAIGEQQRAEAGKDPE